MQKNVNKELAAFSGDDMVKKQVNPFDILINNWLLLNISMVHETCNTARTNELTGNTIVVDDEAYIFSSNTVYSKPLAISKNGKLLLIKKCKKDWCKISSKNIKGWIKKESLWGLY